MMRQSAECISARCTQAFGYLTGCFEDTEAPYFLLRLTRLIVDSNNYISLYRS